MRRFSLFLFLLLFLSTALLKAGTTGKLAGQITDASTGDGLPGVNVQIEGTTLGGSTDVDGVFIILNVPPGLYDVTFSFLGYQTVKVKEVRVNVDFTTRVNQKLKATVVEGDAVEVLGERNPLVRQDLTNTQVAVTSEQIDALPVDAIRDVIALQAGIVEDNSGNLHIRGGRSNEIAFQVNGISINNPFSNSQAVGIATNAIEEVSVSAGTFSAEYGNALSGVINYVTKDGGSSIKASLRGYTGDHFSGRNDIFFNIDEIDPFNNSRFEWTLGGPVPIFGNKLTFFTSGVWQRNKGHLYGIRVYNTDDLLFIDGDNILIDPFGISYNPGPGGTLVRSFNALEAGASGDREIVPMRDREFLNLTGKLTWKPLNNVKISYDVIFDDGQSYPGSAGGVNVFRRFRFTPDGRPQTVSQNISNSLGITHTLTKKFFYTLKFGANFTSASTRTFEDEFDPRYIPPPGNDFSQLIIPNTGFAAGGTYLGRTTTESRSLSAKVDAVYQVLPSHELKFGGEAALHELDLDFFNLLYDQQSSRWIRPTAEVNPDFTDFQQYTRKPSQGALYILDKMELSEKFIFNAGLRYEYLNTEAVYNPDLAGTVDSGVDDPVNLVKADVKHRFSPRASLSFPITERGIIRFSYGWFYQNPTFSSIYTNPRFEDFNFISTPTFGNPNLKPERSIQYEMGLQQQFTDEMKVDFTVFYKDVNDLLQSRRVLAGEVALTKEFNVVTNISYASVKGFTAAFVKRRSPSGLFSSTIDYTFQIGEGAFDDPLALAIDTRTGRQTEQKFIPLDFDRTHTLNGTITLGKSSNWIASAIGSIQSGTPYTPVVPSSVQPINFEANSERRPLLTNVDLKLQKFFKLANSKFSLFMQVENVFDTIRERFIHTNTGRSLTNLAEVTNARLFDNLTEDIFRNPDDFFPVSFLENFYQREDWLGQPREIRWGLTFEF